MTEPAGAPGRRLDIRAKPPQAASRVRGWVDLEFLTVTGPSIDQAKRQEIMVIEATAER